MAVPFIVILPGLLGLVLLQNPDGSRRQLVGEDVVKSCVGNDVGALADAAGCSTAMTPSPRCRRLPTKSSHRRRGNRAAQLQRSSAADDGALHGPGLLGLGITALIAGFMSGMAGNVSAFSTVWTYDIYKPLIKKNGSDSHYVLVGRWSILIGVLVSIGAGYLVQHAHGIMDYVQALFSFFIAPLLAAILMGMFWKRATAPAGFLGLLIGIVSSVGMFIYVKMNPAGLATIALSPDAKPMAENLYRAWWAFCIAAIVIFLVSLVTKPRPVADWMGSATVAPFCQGRTGSLYKNVWLWALLAVCIFAALNILFW